MTSTILWAAFFILAAMFLMAVIVRNVSRLAHRQPATGHPYRRVGSRSRKPPH